MSGHDNGAPTSVQGGVDQSRFPPVTELAVAAMILVIIGGVYMASRLPHPISLKLPVALLAVAGVLLLGSIGLLLRIRSFAWRRFVQVAGWALAAYLVIAGMIGYAFIYDDTPAGPLSVLLGMLGVFAVVVPLLLGFSVARYQPPDAPGGR
ncbi:MAG: hypothetical protein U0Y82_10145 [Thermoleophilia bacterium]